MVERRNPRRFDDLFAGFGAIILRRFFGGDGICSGDIMFGMIFGERIYFKRMNGRAKLLSQKAASRSRSGSAARPS